MPPPRRPDVSGHRAGCRRWRLHAAAAAVTYCCLRRAVVRLFIDVQDDDVREPCKLCIDTSYAGEFCNHGLGQINVDKRENLINKLVVK